MKPNVQKILYATDLSSNATFAFHHAVNLAKMADAQIRILHVVEKMSPDAQLALQAYMDREARQKVIQDRIQHAIDQIKQRLTTFCEIELGDIPDCHDRVTFIDVCQGYPAEEILFQAKKYQCDLIVMGAHEKGIRHTFLGSVAKRVLRRSRIPTLIIPLPSDKSQRSVNVP